MPNFGNDIFRYIPNFMRYPDISVLRLPNPQRTNTKLRALYQPVQLCSVTDKIKLQSEREKLLNCR